MTHLGCRGGRAHAQMHVALRDVRPRRRALTALSAPSRTETPRCSRTAGSSPSTSRPGRSMSGRAGWYTASRMVWASGGAHGACEPPGSAEGNVCRIAPDRVRLTVRACDATTRQRCPCGLGRTILRCMHTCPFSNVAVHPTCIDFKSQCRVQNGTQWGVELGEHQLLARPPGTSVSHSGCMSCCAWKSRKPAPCLPLEPCGGRGSNVSLSCCCSASTSPLVGSQAPA